MIRLGMKKLNTISANKQKKYMRYHQVKLIKYEYLIGEEILTSNQSQISEQAKFTYSPL